MDPKDASKSNSNHVLQTGFRVSQNFFNSDRIFRAYLEKHLPFLALTYMNDKLDKMGRRAAQEMDELSLLADQKGPELIKRDRFGETLDEIRFHPAYDRMLEMAVDSEMLRVKWDPELRAQFGGVRNQLGFASGYLFAMAESGQYCPLCMTDGVAVLLDRFGEQSDRDRLLAGIATNDPKAFLTGAMFLTEKTGGSDVGANLTLATHLEGKYYELKGEKWFCSNVNADIIFALARTDPEQKGIKGLSIFLIEQQQPSGERNPLNIVRLKEKLGVRSMASAECQLNGTVGKLVGEEFQGFKVMAEMINLSRLYNSVAALSGGRRALVEAFQFLSFRVSFGKVALEHSLVRAKLWELGSLHLASFQLVWRTIRALDTAEMGDEKSQQLVRLLTPMAKRDSAEMAVYLARESMELMGGMGYIEDTVLPKIMRDVMVLPIWEGAGNIMVLDMMRAATKTKGLEVLLDEVKELVATSKRYGEILVRETVAVVHGIRGTLRANDQDTSEFLCKKLFLELTRLYQIALLIGDQDQHNIERTEWALKHLMQQFDRCYVPQKPPSSDIIQTLMGWDF